MKPYIVKNKEFLQYFSKLSPKNKIQIIPSLKREELNTISEICKNFLTQNLTTCPKVIKKLKPYKKDIKKFSLKTTPQYKKKKILQSRSGGAIFSVLLPIAASLIGSLIARK